MVDRAILNADTKADADPRESGALAAVAGNRVCWA